MQFTKPADSCLCQLCIFTVRGLIGEWKHAWASGEAGTKGQNEHCVKGGAPALANSGPLL